MKIKKLKAKGYRLSYTVHYCNEFKETYVEYRLITNICFNNIFIDITRYLCRFDKYHTILFYEILTDIITNEICCMNCKYYWANWNYGFCTIDNQNIPCELSHIVKCNAYSEWFGKVD